MRTTVEHFRQFLTQIAMPMKSEGYTKRGNAFSKSMDGNLAVVEFQRSPDPDPSAYVFFVNLESVSRVLYWFETGHSRIPPVPKLYHWWFRLGDLVPDKAPWGWRIEREEDAIPMAEGILELLEQHGLPVLDRHVRDSDLLKTFTRTLNASLEGDIRPLKRLSVLAAALGDHELSGHAIARLREACRDQPCSSAVEEHVEKLARWKW